MTIKAILSDFNSTLWGHHFIIPREVTEILTKDGNRRIIATINNKEVLRSSLIPVNSVESFILINKKVRNGLGLSTGMEATIYLEKDLSTYGMDMPDELSILLEQEDEAAGHFEKLTPGKQRSLIYIVNKVKNSNSRLNKALAIIHHLKEVKGQLDYKMLNETIKFYNAQSKLNK
ncbi:MAG: YdeI/OmpD-associated family protein [Cyclobacteriaceae bacterium]